MPYRQIGKVTPQSDTWQQFQDDLQRLLRNRKVSNAVARQAAAAIKDLCLAYLAFVAYSSSVPPDPTLPGFKKFLRDAESVGSKMIGVLNASRHSGFRTLTPTGFRSWGAHDKSNLLAELEKLTVAARLFREKQKPRPGRRADRNRGDLEMSVAETLNDLGVPLTTAKAGTLARVFQFVHEAIGLSERDPHKAVRKVCDALRAKPTVP